MCLFPAFCGQQDFKHEPYFKAKEFFVHLLHVDVIVSLCCKVKCAVVLCYCHDIADQKINNAMNFNEIVAKNSVDFIISGCIVLSVVRSRR